MPAPDSPPEKAIAKDEAAPAKAATTFLAPGVYVEEVSHRSRTIEGVATGTTAFVGTTARGPAAGKTPELLTSFSDFQMTYSDLPEPVEGVMPPLPAPSLRYGYLEMAVKNFFDNGGGRLYIGRVTTAGGAAPIAEDYRAALATLEDLVDVSIVAAPGATVEGATPAEQVAPIHAELIAHVSRSSAYRMAVLDPPQGCSIDDIKTVRAQVDSSYAALYYPWVTITDPASTATTPGRVNVPPSGFLSGIYARTDSERGVFKAPANQVVKGAIGFERDLTAGENEILNPLGINCLRSFAGRGNLVWGARTTSSDPEWRYVNIRRYFLYLERSIDEGTRWVVFEQNSERLWEQVKQAVADFLFNEWRGGALLGEKPEDAFFVRCDRTTMTQNDLDNGRLICLVGVAPLKPAEFVIFRIGQKTLLPD